MKKLLKLVIPCLLTTAGWGSDWPNWGGHDDRNMVSGENHLAETFAPGDKLPTGGGIDPATTDNVKWTARLGTAAYGNPTVAKGRVFVGTDDATITDDPRFKRSKGGMIKCLDEATGKLLWQWVVPMRASQRTNMLFSHQNLGTCSSPTVDGNRVYIVTGAGDVLCLDVNGQANGNDGPFKDEGKLMALRGEPPVQLTATDGDVIWRYDLLDELGVWPHDVVSCSVLVHGDLLYLSTCNGVDKSHEKIPMPGVPAFIALDKRTGRLAAVENEKISTRLFHAQWSSPSLGKVGRKALVFVGGSDGFCYAFEALGKVPAKPTTLKTAWKYDCNPPNYRFRDGQPIRYTAGDKRKKESPNKNEGTYIGPSEIIATPVFYHNRVYVAIGEDPSHGRGKGMLHCIDATKTGDITQTGRVWSYDGLDRTIATAAIADGLVYIPDVAGRLHCLDADTGRCYWVYETKAETWGGPLVADGKLYFGNQKEFFIMAAGKEAKVLSHVRLGSPVYSTPIAANGVVYAASQQYLWAVQELQGQPGKIRETAARGGGDRGLPAQRN